MFKRAYRGFLKVFLLFSLLLSLLLIASNNVVSADSEPLVPLTDMGNSTYYGYVGGLYPEGQNILPQAHLDAGLALSQQVVPRDASGQPSTQGKIVLLSIGMSNTNMEFEQFREAASNDSSLNPTVVIVNGAQGGMTAAKIKNPNDNATGTQYWTGVDQKLTQAGVTRMQVQAAWLKEADSQPSGSPIIYAQTLQQEQTAIAQILSQRFPNLKLLYISSRIYGGYATTALNPEPYAYASGFSVKWLIEQQISGNDTFNYESEKGAVRAPWMAWGPYLWVNGTSPRSDGLTWVQSDVTSSDGTHPSAQGCVKVANMLLNFFKSESTAQSWFLRSAQSDPTLTAPSPTTSPPSPTPTATAVVPEYPAWVITAILVAVFASVVLVKKKTAFSGK